MAENENKQDKKQDKVEGFVFGQHYRCANCGKKLAVGYTGLQHPMRKVFIARMRGDERQVEEGVKDLKMAGWREVILCEECPENKKPGGMQEIIAKLDGF